MDASPRYACPYCGERLVMGECLLHGSVGGDVRSSIGVATADDAPTITAPAFDLSSPPADAPAITGPPPPRPGPPTPVAPPAPSTAPTPRVPPARTGPPPAASMGAATDTEPSAATAPAPTQPVGVLDPLIDSAKRLGPLGLSAAGVALALLVLLFAIWNGQSDLSGRIDALSRSVRELDRQMIDSGKTSDALNTRLNRLERRVGSQVNFEELAKRVLPSVFTIQAGRAIGSGFVVSSGRGRSDLVTNYHVIAGSRGRVMVRHNDYADVPGRVTRVDPDNDLALIRVSKRFPSLPRAASTPDAGTQVVVVGSPLGLQGTVTNGLISGRKFGLLQFSAPISPGNSGGPVVDTRGRVVGVAVEKLVGTGVEGLSFAVPITQLCSQLLEC